MDPLNRRVQRSKGINTHMKKNIPIDQAGLSREEIQLLELLRYFCSHFAAGLSPQEVLDKGMDPEILETELSGRTVIAFMNVLLAMRQSRKSVFRFNSSHCAVCRHRVSECENLLLSTIRSRRNRELQAARVYAMILCEGNDTDLLFIAIDRMSAEMSLYPEAAWWEK